MTKQVKYRNITLYVEYTTFIDEDWNGVEKKCCSLVVICVVNEWNKLPVGPDITALFDEAMLSEIEKLVLEEADRICIENNRRVYKCAQHGKFLKLVAMLPVNDDKVNPMSLDVAGDE